MYLIEVHKSVLPKGQKQQINGFFLILHTFYTILLLYYDN